MSAIGRGTDLRLSRAVEIGAEFSADLPHRAALLREIAETIAIAGTKLVAIASEETGLPLDRLRGEHARTVAQLRLAAVVAEDGAWLDASITHADRSAQPPLPDLRRMNVALGTVLVFAASNFPLAFGVVGTDTASAWAAGCPVVAKGHPGHPRLAAAIAEVIESALERGGHPSELFTLITDDEEAVDVLRDPRIAAGAFTGSIRGGTALARIAQERPVPIPFFAEMGSVNPVFVTAAAWSARRSEIALGLVESMTVGNGQLCTSPGLLFTPADDGLAELFSPLVADRAPATMVTGAVAAGLRVGLDGFARIPGVLRVAGAVSGGERTALPSVWATGVSELAADPSLLDERFGPTSLVVGYDERADALAAIDRMDGQLTASVFAEDDEDISDLVRHLERRAGRVLLNAWPTGVAVDWSIHHGGPWPASSAPAYGSVGAEGVNRFVRPVAYQGFGDGLLPEPLRDANPLGIHRRVDGRLE